MPNCLSPRFLHDYSQKNEIGRLKLVERGDNLGGGGSGRLPNRQRRNWGPLVMLHLPSHCVVVSWVTCHCRHLPGRRRCARSSVRTCPGSGWSPEQLIHRVNVANARDGLVEAGARHAARRGHVRVFTENRVFWLVLETEFSVLTHVEKGLSRLLDHVSQPRPKLHYEGAPTRSLTSFTRASGAIE